MVLETVKAQVRGNVSREELEGAFDNVGVEEGYEWVTGVDNTGDLFADVASVGEEGNLTVYNIHRDDASAYYVGEEALQEGQREVDARLSNLFVGGKDAMEIVSTFKNELGADVEIIARRYRFDIGEPLFSDVNPENENATQMFSMVGDDVIKSITFGFGTNYVGVTSNSDEEVVRDRVNEIVESIRERENWLEVGEYVISITVELDESFHEDFDSKSQLENREDSKNNKFNYVEYEDGNTVAFSGNTLGVISEKSLEDAVRTVEKLVEGEYLEYPERMSKVKKVDYEEMTPIDELVDEE